MRQALVSTIVFFALTLGGAATPAAAPASLPFTDVLDAPSVAAFSPAAFAPDDRFLAYVVTDNARRREAEDDREMIRSGLAWYALASDIWVTDLQTGEKRNITGRTGNSWAPAWSPDGTKLAFLSDRSGGPKLGPARLWVWERASGALRKVGDADVRESFSGIHWTADGRAVLVSLFPEGLGRDGYAARISPEAPKKEAGGPTAVVFEFDPTVPGATPATDQVNLDMWLRDVGLVDVADGSVTRLTKDQRIGHYVMSPDRRRVVYSLLDRAEKPGTGQYLYDFVVHEIGSSGRPKGAPAIVAQDVRLTLMANSFAWAPAADRFAYRTGGPLATSDEVHVVTVAGGASKKIAANPATDTIPFDVEPPVWDPSGRSVYFTRDGVLWRASPEGSAAVLASSPDRKLAIVAPRQQQMVLAGGQALVATASPGTKRTGFARVDLKTGAMAPLFEEDKRYGGYGTDPATSRDGNLIAYVAEDALHPANLWVLDARSGASKKASEVAPALAGRTYGSARVIEWRSVDGETQRGALVVPPAYEEGKRYPLIVKVYGGSEISGDLNRFGYASASYENLQLFATRGYALLLADSKLGVGTPMVDLMKSVMPGVTKAIDLGIADPERIGVMGHSYGGYSTIALIAQSSLFKAAVMRAGMADLIAGYGQLAADGTNYGLAWSESGQGRMGGSPWEYRERYLENSPVFLLDRVRAPLLIIHGSKDDAVPSYLADEVFTGLRRLGKAVSYARYEGEGHWEGSWSRANQLDALERMFAWFDKYLMNEPPP